MATGEEDAGGGRRLLTPPLPRVLPATSPKVWGPPTWTSLHCLAAGYPESPTPPVRRSCEAFLRSLPWMLPCESCGYHFRQFLRNYPGGVGRIASCREALLCFLVEAHNDVSARTRPGQERWTPERARFVYAAGSAGPAPWPREWSGRSHLVRSEAGGAPTGCSCAAAKPSTESVKGAHTEEL